MINKVTITNHLGESITLDLRNPDPPSGFLVRPPIDGLVPPKADINTTKIVTGDGSVYNSARINDRNILLRLDLLAKPTVEEVRHKSYRYFALKKDIQLVIETENRVCVANGYVESNEPDIFSKVENTVVSIICPDPFLYSTTKQNTVFSGTEAKFKFPFSNESLTNKLIKFGDVTIATEKSVYYEGDASIGVVMYVHSLGVVTNLKFLNLGTREVMLISDAKLAALTGSGIIAGDDIVISTVIGDKYVKLFRGGEEFNILNALEKGYSWFQLRYGDNLFAYTADNGVSSVQFRIENSVVFEGA